MALVMLALGFWTVMLVSYSVSVKHESDAAFEARFHEDYRVYSVNVPKNLTFCGNRVPLFDMDIRERMDRELLVNTYWQSNTLLFHKRAYRWFPIIEPILKEYGVPDDFKYLAVIESGLMNTVSPSGAVGYWQILEPTAKEYGLEVNTEVDERYHVEKSTEAACRFLKDAHDKFGSWEMAAAAYNMGMGGLSRQVKRQRATNYYDLILSQETGRYVFRIIAAKLILENPARYGFYFREKDLYGPQQTVEVRIDSAVTDFANVAAKLNTTYRILKIFNPWLREPTLANKEKKTYVLRLPKRGYFNISAMDPAVLADSALWERPDEFHSGTILPE
ncbi:MAG: lytic transglycosylase domain-containing protein [Flavobacteriales bacterium]|nr:lytic transglycosylase domain-containing protein [Flavobacteriales bacterium]